MTIAACYVSGEGVVFGADSTTTMFVPGTDPSAPGSIHHYNFAQKVFEIGDNSTLGMRMWGLGGLPQVSYRTLIAQFADALVAQGAQSMEEVAKRWTEFFWSAYSASLGEVLQRAQRLSSRTLRTPDEERDLSDLLQAYSGGFCIGGYLINDRTPCAFQILYDPTMTAPAPPSALPVGTINFWGCPNLINRLIFGIDTSLITAIFRSGKWTGTIEDLCDLIWPHRLGQPFHLPIREAIDWVHASIYATIKMMKFSHLPPVCGGPVEVAVITTDKKFRWVRHKQFDAAIGEGGFFNVYREGR